MKNVRVNQCLLLVGKISNSYGLRMNIKGLSYLLIGSVIVSVAVYAGILVYLAWPIDEISINKSGVFGDSFGLLTSLFSGLAFAGLIITIVMQRDELALQREELNLTRGELSGQKEELRFQNETMRTQQFENTFFKMLDLLESCRNDIYNVAVHQSPVEGRDAVRRLYKVFVEGYLNGYNNIDGSIELYFKESSKSIEGMKAEYARFYAEDYGEEIGQYYRTLYNILKFVDSAIYINDKNLYTNLLRAQLSRYELALLFYNCLSKYGEEKMAPLVKRYSILKHLEESTLPKENLDIWREFNA